MGCVWSRCAACGTSHSETERRWCRACRDKVPRAHALLGRGPNAKRAAYGGVLVSCIMRFLRVGDILAFSRSCKTNRRAVERLRETPLGRLHRALELRGLRGLPAVLRATTGAALIGGFLLRAICNGDACDPAWQPSDVDVAVPSAKLDGTLLAISETIRAAGGEVISAGTHTDPLPGISLHIIRYRTARGVTCAIDLFGRQSERFFPHDLTCLMNHYDGRDLTIACESATMDGTTAIGPAAWIDQEQSLKRAWARVEKYRARGFKFDLDSVSALRAQRQQASARSEYLRAEVYRSARARARAAEVGRAHRHDEPSISC
jgi:hypothetical protein